MIIGKILKVYAEKSKKFVNISLSNFRKTESFIETELKLERICIGEISQTI